MYLKLFERHKSRIKVRIRLHRGAGSPAAFTHDGFSGHLRAYTITYPPGPAAVGANPSGDSGAVREGHSEHCLQPRREHQAPVRGSTERREEGAVVGLLGWGGADEPVDQLPRGNDGGAARMLNDKAW